MELVWVDQRNFEGYMNRSREQSLQFGKRQVENGPKANVTLLDDNLRR